LLTFFQDGEDDSSSDTSSAAAPIKPAVVRRSKFDDEEDSDKEVLESWSDAEDSEGKEVPGALTTCDICSNFSLVEREKAKVEAEKKAKAEAEAAANKKSKAQRVSYLEILALRAMLT